MVGFNLILQAGQSFTVLFWNSKLNPSLSFLSNYYSYFSFFISPLITQNPNQTNPNLMEGGQLFIGIVGFGYWVISTSIHYMNKKLKELLWKSQETKLTLFVCGNWRRWSSRGGLTRNSVPNHRETGRKTQGSPGIVTGERETGGERGCMGGSNRGGDVRVRQNGGHCCSGLVGEREAIVKWDCR